MQVSWYLFSQSSADGLFDQSLREVLAEMVKLSNDDAAAILFLSRESIEPNEYPLAQALCAKVSDWSRAAMILERKFTVSIAYSNLIKIKPVGLSADVLEQMKASAMRASMLSLRMIAAQDSFYVNCLQPLNCRHAFLKGTGLARQYYRDAGARVCRDIDLLVAEDSIEAVVRSALSCGYKVLIKKDTLTNNPSERALRALLDYAQIVTLLSPEQVWFEVHTHIDYGLELFETEQLLNAAVLPADQKAGAHVLATPHHFCFVCYHSTRHTWSRLHWLSDIDAMSTHMSFELEKVIGYARDIGLEPTVNAALAFLEAVKSGKWTDPTVQIDPRARELLNDCIANLADDYETEMKRRAQFNYLGLPYTWMLDRTAKPLAYLNRSRARVRPSYYLYESMPLPPALQWLYYPAKPLFVLMTRIIIRKNT